jgi:hypothetical protein
MLVTNYQSTLHNVPEERRSHLHRDRSLKPCTLFSTLQKPLKHDFPQKLRGFTERIVTSMDCTMYLLAEFFHPPPLKVCFDSGVHGRAFYFESNVVLQLRHLVMGRKLNMGSFLQMTILLRMDDKMNRQLTCSVSEIDTSLLLAQELVHFGFINEVVT